MKISVVIPAYNAGSTIRATLDSVLHQTVQPHEVLVMDDGSTDNTSSILESYMPRVTSFQQPNGGLSSGRNFLCLQARGDLIAFLDSDDVWHPKYLEVQLKSFRQHPGAVAGFTGHVNFRGDGGYEWGPDPDFSVNAELMPPIDFFRRYNTATAHFASYSFCCATKRALTELGPEPFKENGAEDFFCSALLSLLGPVFYTAVPVAAYRVRAGSISSDRIKGLAARVRAFEVLEKERNYLKVADPALAAEFTRIFASHRRVFAKQLMGASEVGAAREQLRFSLRSREPKSIGKSLALLFSTYFPSQLQPKWPTSYQR